MFGGGGSIIGRSPGFRGLGLEETPGLGLGGRQRKTGPQRRQRRSLWSRLEGFTHIHSPSGETSSRSPEPVVLVGGLHQPHEASGCPPQVPPPPALGCTSPPLPGFRFETTFTALVSWPTPRPPCPHPSLSLRPPLLHALSSPLSFPAHFFPQSSSLCFSLGLEPPTHPQG